MLKRGFQFAPGYRLQEFLGRGQFGQVWRASAPGGAATAVKFIDLSDGQGQKEYDAVRRVKQIRHANLMPITAIWLLDAQGRVIEEAPDEAIETIDLSAIEAPGQSAMYQPEVEPSWLVVAMLLGGKSLLKRLQECVAEGLPGIPPKELISYMDEAAKGIDFLNSPQHDLGEGPIAIQHSDIKPANIVLIGSSAVVCDFGLARILTRNQVTATSAAGTPAYMAPEAIAGKPSRTSDQYSLAVTYYHLRTGSLPVSDGSLWEVLDAHRHGKLKLGLASAAEQLVLRKATDLNWENRFESNLDFVEALREALRAEGQTRPSFLDLTSSESAGETDRSTRPVEADATATLDFARPESSAGSPLQATASLIQADESTHKEGFVDATLPELQEAAGQRSTPVQPSPSILDRIRQHPMISAGVAGAAFVVMAIAMLAGQGEENGDRTQNGSQVIEKSADDLLAEAIAMVDQDATSAKSLFQQAMAKDPKLQPQVRELHGQNGSVMKMETTPDGKWLLAMDDGPAPRLRDLARPEAAMSLEGHETLLNAMAIQPATDLLLTGGFDSNARVWNLRSKSVADTPLLLSGHDGAVEAVAWSPTEPVAITVSSNLTQGLGEIGLWEILVPSSDRASPTIKRQKVISIGNHLKSVACDPTNKWIAGIALGGNRAESTIDVVAFDYNELWDREGSPDPVTLSIPGAEHIAFLSQEGEPRLAVGESGGTVAIYSIAGGDNLIDRINETGSSSQNHIEAMKVVTVNEDDVIVAGTADGVLLWSRYGDSAENKRRELGNQPISCLDVSSDGRWVAAGTSNGSIVLWDTASVQNAGTVMLSTDAKSTDSVSIDSIAISTASNLLIAGGSDGVIRTWNLKHLKLLTMVENGSLIEEPLKEKKLPSPKVAQLPTTQRPFTQL